MSRFLFRAEEAAGAATLCGGLMLMKGRGRHSRVNRPLLLTCFLCADWSGHFSRSLFSSFAVQLSLSFSILSLLSSLSQSLLCSLCLSLTRFPTAGSPSLLSLAISLSLPFPPSPPCQSVSVCWCGAGLMMVSRGHCSD